MLKKVVAILTLLGLLAGCTVEVNSYYTPSPGYLTDREIYETVLARNGRSIFLTRREIVQGARAPIIEQKLGGRNWRCYTPVWRSVRYAWCTTERRLDTMLRSVHDGYEYEDMFRLLPYGSLGTFTPVYLVQR
jgi:hypothetical protein